jgi:hypothetical protein
MMAKSQFPDGSIPACASKGGGHKHPENIEYMPGIPHGSTDRWVLLNYCCDFAGSVREYILFTGDASILNEIYGSVKKVIGFLWGLLDFEKPGVFSTDGRAETAAPEPRYDILTDVSTTPKAAVVSRGAFLWQIARCFRETEETARLAGDNDFALQLAERYTALAAHINEHFFNSEPKLYVDKPRDPGSLSIHPAIYHILTQSLKGEAVSPEEEKFLRHSSLPVMGVSLVWAVESLYQAGFVTDALNATRSAWGRMLDYGPGTCWERMDNPVMDKTVPMDAPASYCHGWTAGPAWQFPMYILGIRPKSPGYRELIVKPDLAFLDYAEATVPVPHGSVFVRAEKAGGAVKTTLSIPPGVERCEVLLPGLMRVYDKPGIYVIEG